MPDEKQVETTTTDVATETVVETPEVKGDEFDKARAMALIEKLRAENKEAAKAKKRLEEFEQADAKRKEAEMTESEKATKRAQELEAKLKAYERTEAQRKAAEKVGLPGSLAIRLMGETPEELEADAKALLESLPKPEKKSPGINPTNPSNASQDETREQKKARLQPGSIDPFAKGAGIFWGEKPEGS